MKWKSSLLICTMLMTIGLVHAQTPIDNRPNYEKNPGIPAFKLVLIDSSLFTNTMLPTADYTCLIYFSPDCGHCQYEAEQMIRNMDSLKNIQFVWISYRDFQDIKAFARKYQFDFYPNIITGRDPEYAVPSFYQVKFTPFVALYNKDKQFLKVWDKGVEIPELLEFIRRK